ncbi:hypothetical protein [uncultured Cellulomonas sp.]|uniref:hypothetical protein n=1 Tax=uncultured Cellulomonas sp. TaxID=189682 RepID=UPI0028E842C4|nr:hypothetical protein [uncultured Cellulomonas sp.]
MSEPGIVDPTTSWIEVVALLSAAAGTALTGSPMGPAPHSLALGAHIVAADALELLPLEVDSALDDVIAPIGATLVELIRAAHLAAGRHPVESLPEGAGAVIDSLDALVTEARAVS